VILPPVTSANKTCPRKPAEKPGPCLYHKRGPVPLPVSGAGNRVTGYAGAVPDYRRGDCQCRHRRGKIWRAIRNSPGIQISIYFLAFALLIGVNTWLFHSYYPVLENKTISWTEALMFVVESMTTVGYGWLLPFTNDVTPISDYRDHAVRRSYEFFMVIPLLIATFPFYSSCQPAPPQENATSAVRAYCCYWI